MPFLVLWYSWPRLLRIPTESISTSKLSCVGFRCKEFDPLVLWIWNQNIAISTIVGTSSHINNFFVCLFVFVFVFVFFVVPCLCFVSFCFVLFCFVFLFWVGGEGCLFVLFIHLPEETRSPK